jgi:chromosome segregation ATPase
MLSLITKMEENLAVLKKHFTTEPANAGGDEVVAIALTPIQKFEKRLEAATEKLDALSSKKVTAKTNVEKDAETKAKLEETIEDLRKKISELAAKPAKKTKAVEAEAEAEKPAAKPAKKTKAVEAEAEAEAEKPAAKNIPKSTVALRTRLEKSFKDANIPWDASYTEQYIEQMNELTKDEYTSTTESDRMSGFANTKAPAAAGGAIKTLSVSELRKQNSDLTKISTGIYRNKKTNETVTGPEEVTGEAVDEGELDGVMYSIGETTKRVYDFSSEEFMGYWGVGEFYNADL